MSDTDWKCDLCGRKREGGEKPPQGWVNTQRPCSFSGEMEDVVICGSCMACLDAARLADVNGLAERIAESACDHAPDFNRFGGADFKSHVAEMLAPLLSENERLRADVERLHKFKNKAANILLSLTSGVIRVMEEQLDQSRKVAAQMGKEIDDFTQEPPNAK